MKTRSSGPWLLALGCAMALAIVLAAPASAQRYTGGGRHDGSGIWHDGPGWHGGSWHGGTRNWHGGGGWHGSYGRGFGWGWGGGVFIAPRPYSSCSYGYCYGYVPPAYYGY